MREKDIFFFSFSRTKEAEKKFEPQIESAQLDFFLSSRARESDGSFFDFDQNEKAEEKEARAGKREEKTSTFDTFKLTTSSHRIYYRTRRRFSSRTQKTPAAIAIIVSILTIGLNAIAAARLHCFFQLSRQRIRALTGRASISHLVLFPY